MDLLDRVLGLAAIVTLRSSTFLRLHQALVRPKYHLLYASGHGLSIVADRVLTAYAAGTARKTARDTEAATA
jgi:hypothetical protein